MEDLSMCLWYDNIKSYLN